MLPALKEKQLTEMQQKFLDALFGEALGNPHKAKQLAGYDETTSTSKVVKSVQEEILEHSRLYLATYTPQALLEMMNMLVNPNEPGSTVKLKVIQEILNRAGVVDQSKQSQDGMININNKGRIIILPEKNTSKQIELDRSEFKEINDILVEISDDEDEEV